jgi:hypothetical protein
MEAKASSSVGFNPFIFIIIVEAMPVGHNFHNRGRAKRFPAAMKVKPFKKKEKNTNNPG